MSGPGYVGLENLGNSCYMNSVLQVGVATSSVNDDACSTALGSICTPWNSVSVSTAIRDHILQHLWTREQLDMSDGQVSSRNLGWEVWWCNWRAHNHLHSSGSDSSSLKPWMFKQLVAKNHADFSSNMQQVLAHTLRLLTLYCAWDMWCRTLRSTSNICWSCC